MRFLQRRHGLLRCPVLVPRHGQPMHPLRHAQRVGVGQRGSLADGLLLDFSSAAKFFWSAKISASASRQFTYSSLSAPWPRCRWPPEPSLPRTQVVAVSLRGPPLRIRQFQPEAHALFRRSLAGIRLFHRHRQVTQGFAKVAGLQVTLGFGAMPVAVERPGRRLACWYQRGQTPLCEDFKNANMTRLSTRLPVASRYRRAKADTLASTVAGTRKPCRPSGVDRNRPPGSDLA